MRSAGAIFRAPLLAVVALLALHAGAGAQEPPRDAAVREWVLSPEAELPPEWGEAEREILFRLLAEGSRHDTPEQRRILQALELLEPRRLGSWVARRVSPSSPEAERVAALRVLAAVGGTRDLPLCERIAVGSPQGPLLGDELRHAYAGLLQRHPETFERLWVLFEETPAELRRFAFEAVGDVPERSALADLADWLDRARDLRPTILGSMTLVAASSPAPTEAELRENVRRLLDEDSATVRAAAALACGALEDADACGTLIELLQDQPAPVRHAALDALRTISGHDFRADPDRWRSWYATERQWWSERAPSVFRALRTGSTTEVVSAIGELVAHSLDRHRLASELIGCLEHEEARIRRLAALGLGALGSVLAVPALQLAVQDEEEPVRAAAEQALASCSPPTR